MGSESWQSKENVRINNMKNKKETESLPPFQFIE
jgi:hypothetical protein